MKKSICTTALMVHILLSGNTFAEPFEGANNPQNFSQIYGSKLETKYELLPLAGIVNDSSRIWSGSVWASNLGGISHRFASPYPDPFQYEFHSKDALSKMDLGEMKELSPSELYDISQGDYNYTLTRKIRGMTNPKDFWWEGINHGWAQAAVNYAKPVDVTIVNPDGILVPFTSAHVQALISAHESYNYKGAKFGFVGMRCQANGQVRGEEDPRNGTSHTEVIPEVAESPACKDINPGSFHIILSNMVGIKGSSFVADIARYNEVRNVPVKSFKVEVLDVIGVHDEKVNVKIKVSNTVVFAHEIESGSIEQIYGHRKYQYFLELDKENKIIGGEWISETRPDFLWLYEKKPTFVNDFLNLKGLNQIYKPQ